LTAKGILRVKLPEHGLIQAESIRRPALAYRPEIDGLRAVAVLAVVFGHAGIAGFSGGYVGVDVFFVISGYLITGLIHPEIQSGRFSLIGFYERRARRILPALILLMAATGAAGWLVMTPSDFQSLARSLIATAFFGANLHFWQSIDYFSLDAAFLPLLHTWSLAVEEQYYLLWPLFLMVAAVSRRLLILGVLFVLVASLGASILLSGFFPKESFYLLPTRAWELMTGAALALGMVPGWRDRRWAEAASLVGIVMILTAVATFDDRTVFPGAAALLPCLGTALIVHSGGGTGVGRALAARPAVFIGLISYSLYLWHWPILAFLRIGYGVVELPWPVTLIAIAFSFVAAILSWRMVETPFRRRGTLGRRTIFTLSGAGTAAIVAAGIATTITEGWPSRLSEQTARIAAGAQDMEPDKDFCVTRVPPDRLCRIGAAVKPPTVLLWGDSHAGTVRAAIDRALKSADLGGVLAARVACAPLLGVRRLTPDSRSCSRFNDAVLQMLEAEESPIETVILAARWALNATGERMPGEGGSDVALIAQTGEAPGNAILVERGLSSLLDRLRLANRRVVLLGGVPEIGWLVPQTLVARLRLGLHPPAAPELSDVRRRNREADAILAKLAERPGVDFVPIAPLLCNPRCPVLDGDRAVYRDDNHLTVYGAWNILGPRILTDLALAGMRNSGRLAEDGR
jgi:peptidoglycan/LPS O-acetylase OafA/YrhL